MLVVLLWTLFGVCVAAAIGFAASGICGIFDADYRGGRRYVRLRFVSVALAIILGAGSPFLAWGASYLHAEGRCAALGGEFRTYINGAGWECLLDEDFGPLPVEQNRRLDITGIGE